MWGQLTLLTSGVVLCAYFAKKMSQGWWERINNKYRIKEDLYLVPLLRQLFHHYVTQCLITKKFTLWDEYEQVSLGKKSDSKIAVKYARQIKDFKEFGEDAFEVESFTYKELYNQVLRMSSILRNEYGITKADVVTMFYMNKPLFIIIWLALWNLGATPSFR